jgi:hypothetical protein
VHAGPPRQLGKNLFRAHARGSGSHSTAYGFLGERTARPRTRIAGAAPPTGTT